MSTYLEMWRKINALSPAARDRWIKNIGNPRGQAIDFQGVLVLDVDLLEALKSAKRTD